MRVSNRLLAWVVFFIGIAVYLPSLQNGFLWDDEVFFLNNENVAKFDVVKMFTESTTSGAGQTSNYYRPLTSLSFAIDYQLWGEKPLG